MLFTFCRSKDDIFLLYAALYSGPDSRILSRDFMRNHKFAIGPNLNAIFKQWQQQCWCTFEFIKGNQIHIWQPIKFKMFCHKSDNHWHIPFIGDEETKIDASMEYEMPNRWACIQL